MFKPVWIYTNLSKIMRNIHVLNVCRAWKNASFKTPFKDTCFQSQSSGSKNLWWLIKVFKLKPFNSCFAYDSYESIHILKKIEKSEKKIQNWKCERNCQKQNESFLCVYTKNPQVLKLSLSSFSTEILRTKEDSYGLFEKRQITFAGMFVSLVLPKL